ncbi:MAG: hypothetical protein ABEH81_12960 [Halopenitus sp.]
MSGLSAAGLDPETARDLLRDMGYECRRCGEAFNCEVCGGASDGDDGESTPTEGSNADPEQVADLAERSAFTREQVRAMSEAERERLAETLAGQAAETLTENVGTFAALSREDREAADVPEAAVGALAALSEADEDTPATEARAGALTALSERESDEADKWAGGALTTLNAREDARESDEARAEGQATETVEYGAVGALTSLSTGESAGSGR